MIDFLIEWTPKSAKCCNKIVISSCRVRSGPIKTLVVDAVGSVVVIDVDVGVKTIQNKTIQKLHEKNPFNTLKRVIY